MELFYGLVIDDVRVVLVGLRYEASVHQTGWHPNPTRTCSYVGYFKVLMLPNLALARLSLWPQWTIAPERVVRLGWVGSD